MTDNLNITCRWRPFPDEPPPQLESGHYVRYLVALKSESVLECSWLDGGWHQRHDGCSDVTEFVCYWMPLPEAPNKEN